jgi:pimeloyl-ACP methyl ester carboxylesterase
MEEVPYTYETARTAFVNVNGVSIAYRSIGLTSAVPLLCLPHFTGTMDGWDPAVINGLSKERQVILFDNMGVGESAGTTPDTVTVMAADTLAFLAALGLRKVDLLGFSLGGFISQLTMSEKPEIVRKAILVGTCQQGGEGISTFREFVKGAAGLEGADQYFYFFFEDTTTSRTLGHALLSRFHQSDPNWHPSFTDETFEAQTKAILGWGDVPDGNSPMLTRIRHPVLIVNGSNDHMFATANSLTMFQQLPNAVLSLYPDSSHGSIFQYPGLFTNQANCFLDNFS